MTKEQSPCSVEECESPVLAKGLCRPHYLRERRAALTRSREALAKPAESNTVSEDSPKPELLPLPYPGFEEFSHQVDDERAFAKTMANIAATVLNENPDNPRRQAIKAMLDKHARIAEMDDQAYLAHRLQRANPLNELSQDERFHCIRTLPLPIVQKLFPYV